MKRIEKIVAVGMPQELYDKLKRLAVEDERSVPSCIRLILWEYLKQR